ncbi:MAG: DUF4132 domain-containing protein [Ruminococcus sp.]|nr:DUF4132 domain-containing protein [Ruminococcus sp.]
MLYAHGKTQYTKLIQSLIAVGFPEANADALSDFLDMEKEIDFALLDRIPKLDILRPDWRMRTDVISAFDCEIVRKRNDDLLQRGILLLEQLFGIDLCYYTSTYRVEHPAAIKTAMNRRYGERCVPHTIAIFAHTLSSGNVYSTLEMIRPYSKPADYASALDLCSKDDKNTIAFLAARCIDLSDSETPAVKRAVEGLLSIMNANKLPSEKAWNLTMTGLALASVYSDTCEELFKANLGKFADMLVDTAMCFDHYERILDLIDSVPEAITDGYIDKLTDTANFTKGRKKARIENLSRVYPDIIARAVKNCPDDGAAAYLAAILRKECPEKAIDADTIKEISRRRIIKNISGFAQDVKYDIERYLNGSVSFADTLTKVNDRSIRGNFYDKRSMYYTTYGEDGFLRRCIALLTAMCRGRIENAAECFLNVSIVDHPDVYMRSLMAEKASPEFIIKSSADIVDNLYYKKEQMFGNLCLEMKKHPDELSEAVLTEPTVTERLLFLNALSGKPGANKEKILAMAGDTSKVVKARFAEILGGIPSWHDDIVQLLSSKKAALREIALDAIERQSPADYKEELAAAFEKEKSEKLRIKAGTLMGLDIAPAEKKDTSSGDIIKDLTKGGKAKKVAWLFTSPFKPVKFVSNGEAAPDEYLQALMLCYSSLTKASRSETADQIAAMFDQKDLALLAAETLGRWIADNAPAKNKWVLWFSAVHGGQEVFDTLIQYIKEWAENARGAIAAEAVRSLALNGSSPALMAVDSMARKFKNRQVRNAAGEAMADAAEQLGITTDELGDRIVPDMGFDDHMCRTFDYGKRQFKVYLTPSLEIEIFNGDKKVKNMPKPGVTDDQETANAAYTDFKNMKKQMKEVVASQKQRLEYVLMCDRKWTPDGWNALFVKNPVMHCFAVGLIWGAYRDGKLETSFRYMDDGSFTTSDEDEFEIPGDVQIGLVHPIELSAEERKTWLEQLSDYEIVQPFPQLARQTFAVTDEEKGRDDIIRFDGITISNQTLAGRMAKYGWEKGMAQDAGCFFEFQKTVIASKDRLENGSYHFNGYYAELKFSGTYIGVFEMDPEDVDIEELRFYRIHDQKPLKVEEVSKRFFSEIIYQLTAICGSQPEE